MNRDGYTLVEMAVALAILGLAITALLQGLHIVGRFSGSEGRSLREARARAELQAGLDRLLMSQGPFFSDSQSGLTGDARAFSFPCGVATCGAELSDADDRWRMELRSATGETTSLRLPASQSAQFSYSGERTSGSVWPQATSPRQRLTLITLVQGPLGAAEPDASVKLWLEEPGTCSFDVISQACRQ